MVAATKNFQTFPVRSCSLPFVIPHLLFFLDTIWPQERPRHLFVDQIEIHTPISSAELRVAKRTRLLAGRIVSKRLAQIVG